MSKSIIIFIYFVSLALITHQNPLSDQPAFILCPKGDKRCGKQCYNPEKYVCHSFEDDSTPTVTTRSPSIEQTAKSVTKSPSVSTTKASTTSTIAPATSSAILQTETTSKSTISRMCRIKGGSQNEKECLCDKKILYNPQKHICRDGKLICKKGNKNCNGTAVKFINNRAQPVALFATKNGAGEVTTLIANLETGQAFDYNLPNGWAGNFRHTDAGKSITQFEISVRTDDPNQIFYNLSNVEGDNGVMTVTPPGGQTLRSPMDAYQFWNDDSNTHGLGEGNGGHFLVTFE